MNLQRTLQEVLDFRNCINCRTLITPESSCVRCLHITTCQRFKRINIRILKLLHNFYWQMYLKFLSSIQNYAFVVIKNKSFNTEIKYSFRLFDFKLCKIRRTFQEFKFYKVPNLIDGLNL